MTAQSSPPRAEPRHAHTKQFKRAGKSLRSVKTYLGRVFRDIVGKAKGSPELKAAKALMPARRVHGGLPQSQSHQG